MGKHYHSLDRWDVRARQINGEQQSRNLQNQASEKQGTAAQIQPVKINKRYPKVFSRLQSGLNWYILDKSDALLYFGSL
jgi:hypothetical protein